MQNTIFVQIASYTDPELIPTLLDLIGKADHPENLHVCVCWQHGEEQTVEDFLNAGFDVENYYEKQPFSSVLLSYKNAQIELIDVDKWKTEGACWARNLIQQQYAKEKYTLQLDSHHRFIPSWDTTVIADLESVRDVSPKPVLTAYIPSYDPENDPAGRVLEPWKMDFDRFIPEGCIFFMPSTVSDYKERTKPMLSRFYSAHFAFADGSFAEEVKHDPTFFFHSEESSISVRAFTHGYDLYHPVNIIAWHEYTRKNRIKIWDEHTTEARNKGNVKLDWVQRNDACHKRNRILFGMDGEDPNSVDFGEYGFGKSRTLKDYEEYAGISFKYRAVQQCVLDHIEPTLNWKKYDSEEEWKASLTRSNDVRILVNKSELRKDVTDYDFWYLGTHDENNVEVYRKDKTQPDINNMLKDSGEWLDFRFIYLSNHIAKTYTVWPHSASLGWLDKITKNID